MESREEFGGDLPLLSMSAERGVRERPDGQGRAASEDLSRYRVVEQGDLVINKLSARDGAYGVSRLSGLVSPAYWVLRPVNGAIETRWLDYVLRSAPYAAELSRISKHMPPAQFDLSWDQFRSLPIPVPPEPAQRMIADYLDTETARIDALIVKKTAMLELLEERWQAHLRWLAHSSDWPWVPLRRLWTVTDCKHVTPEYSETGIPVVSPGDVTPGRLDLGRCHRFVNETAFAELTGGGRRPLQGDVVYSRNASIGIASYVDTEKRFTMGQDVCLIRSSNQDQLWLTFMLNSVGIDQLQEMKIGSTFDRVNIAQLQDLRIPAPEPAVQRVEAARLDAYRARTDRLRDRLTSQIGLLREHRQALITAAVTGELEISGAA